jgi:hypothetical protein
MLAWPLPRGSDWCSPIWPNMAFSVQTSEKHCCRICYFCSTCQLCHSGFCRSVGVVTNNRLEGDFKTRRAIRKIRNRHQCLLLVSVWFSRKTVIPAAFKKVVIIDLPRCPWSGDAILHWKFPTNFDVRCCSQNSHPISLILATLHRQGQ